MVHCAPEHETAQLLVAAVTTPEWQKGQNVALPNQLTCGGGTVKIAGGNGTGSFAGMNGARIRVKWDFELNVPAPAGAKQDDYMLSCKLTLESELKPDPAKSDYFWLPSPVTLPDCTDFDCSLRRVKVNCAKLQQEMSKVCN